MLGSCNIWARDVLKPFHEARGQLVVVVEGALLVHPSPEDAFVDAHALTSSIDEGVEPKIKTRVSLKHQAPSLVSRDALPLVQHEVIPAT